MLSPTLLDPDQLAAVDRIYEHDYTLLYAGMGAGKTIVTLTAIAELIRDNELERVLIIAPPKVCATVWRQECEKWSHLAGLKTGYANGTSMQRKQMLDNLKYNVVCMSIDVVPWFCTAYKGGTHHFDGLVIDELSKFKASRSNRYKRLKHRVNDFMWRVGLTGTPVSEDMEGLFSQVGLLDAGKRFGGNKRKFLGEYFYPTDYEARNWVIKGERAERALVGAVADMVHELPDYRHTLPALTEETVLVELTLSAREAYDVMARTQEYAGEVAENAGVLQGKLEQIANGFLYCNDEFGERYHTFTFDTPKPAAIRQIVDNAEGGVAICYWFTEELEQLKRAFPSARIFAEERDTAALVADWSAGGVSVLLIHPMSAGHGLQLEQGGHTVIWSCPVWSRDLYDQTNARLWRRGQPHPVSVYTVAAADTVDEVKELRLEGKAEHEVAFKGHLKAIRGG